MHFVITYTVAVTLFSVLKRKYVIELKLSMACLIPSIVTRLSLFLELDSVADLPFSVGSNKTVIIDMCKKVGHGMTTTTSITKARTSLVGSAFVHNADLVTCTDCVNTIGEDLIPKFQEPMLTWRFDCP